MREKPVAVHPDGLKDRCIGPESKGGALFERRAEPAVHEIDSSQTLKPDVEHPDGRPSGDGVERHRSAKLARPVAFSPDRCQDFPSPPLDDVERRLAEPIDYDQVVANRFDVARESEGLAPGPQLSPEF